MSDTQRPDERVEMRRYIASEPFSDAELQHFYDTHANYGGGRWERRILGNLEALQAERDAALARAERAEQGNERLRKILYEIHRYARKPDADPAAIYARTSTALFNKRAAADKEPAND